MARVNQSNTQERAESARKAKQTPAARTAKQRAKTRKAQLGTLPGEGDSHVPATSYARDPKKKIHRTFGGEHTGKKRNARKKAK